jgi:U3 small nucleolar RNA-associated protein MPP10
MKTLFAKLDALSNCHYTPKAVSAEIRIVTNVPAIAMEEVAPVTVADSTLLAPQEIQAPVKGVIKGKDERTDTDRKRERRVKKKKQKFIHSAREEKAKAKEARLEAKMARKLEEKERPRKNQIKFK